VYGGSRSNGPPSFRYIIHFKKQTSLFFRSVRYFNFRLSVPDHRLIFGEGLEVLLQQISGPRFRSTCTSSSEGWERAALVAESAFDQNSFSRCLVLAPFLLQYQHKGMLGRWDGYAIHPLSKRFRRALLNRRSAGTTPKFGSRFMLGL